MAKCELCGKGPVTANNISKTRKQNQHKEHRMVQPNVQKIQGIKMCTRCLRTLKKTVQEVENKVTSGELPVTV